MALYRRHLMEAANNQNVDIYTVEQVKRKSNFILILCVCVDVFVYILFLEKLRETPNAH